jgi:predicted alpha/beta hydrolase
MLALTDANEPGLVEVETFDLPAEDGTLLGATLFHPRAARGVLIVHGATATPQSYYRRFAYFAAQATGARVLTYDYRGIGRSRPLSLRGFEATMHDWAVLDGAAAHAHARVHYRGEPVALIGHSFGGQLVGLLDDARDTQGALLVGSQLAYYRDWPAAQQLRLAFTWRALVPALNAVFGYTPGRFGLGEDLPRGVSAQWARWCLSPEYLIAEYPDARQRFARFDRPTLFYSFTDDAYAPRGAVEHLLRRLSNAPVEHVRVDPREHGGDRIGHFGFFRPRFAPTLWEDAAAFLREALDGRAHGRRPVSESAPRTLSDEVMADLQYGRAS